MIRLFSVIAVFSDLAASDVRQFVGVINRNEKISDIVGTSGGPILGIRMDADGRNRYWPVAIQSRWRRRSRIVVGTSIPIVAQRIHDWIAEFEQTQGNCPT